MKPKERSDWWPLVNSGKRMPWGYCLKRPRYSRSASPALSQELSLPRQSLISTGHQARMRLKHMPVVAGATVKNLSGQALANELVQAIRTPQDIQKLDMARAARFRASAYGGATALTGMLMLLNYSKLLEDVEKGMSHELAEAKDKLTLGQVAIGGFVAEQLGGALEKVGETPLKNMAGRFGGYMPNILKLTGRFAGFGVGVLLGLWDISKGVDSGQQGDHGMAIAYLSSGTAAVVVSSVMFGMAMGALSLGPIGWIVLALGVLIWLGATLFIESSKDNKRQEWLSRCHFGTGADKYPDAQTHT